MKITKLGHCCLLIEERGLRILTDPGAFTIEAQEKVKEINLVVITHEHQDHLHVDSLKQILKNNPNASVITNGSVKGILEKNNLQAEVVADGENTSVKGFLIEGFGKDHAPIYQNFGLVENTGYFFGNSFFYPGDAFYVPKKQAEILALPMAGPWMKISEAIDYAKEMKPKFVFPVHDGILNHFGGFIHMVGQNFLKPEGLEYITPDPSRPMEF